MCLHFFPIVFESLNPGKGHLSKGEKSISHSPRTTKIVFRPIHEVIDLT